MRRQWGLGYQLRTLPSYVLVPLILITESNNAPGLGPPHTSLIKVPEPTHKTRQHSWPRYSSMPAIPATPAYISRFMPQGRSSLSLLLGTYLAPTFNISKSQDVLLSRGWSCLKQMPVTPIQNWLPCLIENDLPRKTISYYLNKLLSHFHQATHDPFLYGCFLSFLFSPSQISLS